MTAWRAVSAILLAIRQGGRLFYEKHSWFRLTEHYCSFASETSMSVVSMGRRNTFLKFTPRSLKT